MFFGFASLFATYFGGFGYDAGHLDAAFVRTAAMCALGLLCATLGLRLMLVPPPAAPDPVVQFGTEGVTALVNEAPA